MAGPPIKFDYNQVIALIAKKEMTFASIEKELGMHKSYLSHYCKRHKINHGRVRNRIYDYSQVLKLTRERMSLSSISEKLKIPYNYLYNYCKHHGISYIAKGIRGHKYDHNQIDALIAEEGRTLTSIAEEIGVGLSAFSHYCKRHKINHGRTVAKYKYDDINICKLTKEGMPLAAISEKLKIPYKLLHTYCKSHNIPFQGKGYGTRYDYSQLPALIEKDGTLPSISKKLNIPYGTLYNHCKSRNILFQMQKKGRVAKYDYSQVPALVKEGKSLPFISKKLNMPYACLYNYCKCNRLHFKKVLEYRLMREARII